MHRGLALAIGQVHVVELDDGVGDDVQRRRLLGASHQPPPRLPPPAAAPPPNAPPRPPPPPPKRKPVPPKPPLVAVAVGITIWSPWLTPDTIWVTLSPSTPTRTGTVVC